MFVYGFAASIDWETHQLNLKTEMPSYCSMAGHAFGQLQRAGGLQRTGALKSYILGVSSFSSCSKTFLCLYDLQFVPPDSVGLFCFFISLPSERQFFFVCNLLQGREYVTLCFSLRVGAISNRPNLCTRLIYTRLRSMFLLFLLFASTRNRL